MLKQASGGERTSATAEPGQATNEGAASIGRRSSFSMPAGYWQHYGVSPAPHLVSPIARKQDTSATDPSEGVSATETFARATSGASGEVPFRADMEQAFGEKFSTVRSFVGQDGPMRDISAKAATQGERIAFASSSPDKRLVAHELAHVAQNRHGGQQGVATKSNLSNPGDASEKEADDIANKVASGGQVHNAIASTAKGAAAKAGACCDDCGPGGSVQRSEDGESAAGAAAHAEKQRATADRIAAVATAGLAHVHRISSPQAAAEKERELMARVNLLQQHRDKADPAAGDPEAQQKIERQAAMVDAAHARLASTAGKGGSPEAADVKTTTVEQHGTPGKPHATAGTSPKAGALAQQPDAQTQDKREVIHRSPECDDLLEQIRQLVEEIKQRFQELLDDKQNLQWDHWPVSNPLPPFGSVEGHQIQFDQKQQALRKRMNKWNDQNCDGGGGELPSEAMEWATKPTPSPIPRPRPAPPVATPEPVSHRGFWAALAIGCAIGIAIILTDGAAAPLVLAL